MNQPYIRVRIQMIGTENYIQIERKGAYHKYSGSKRKIRKMLEKSKSNLNLTKE